jgi:hypothetical protein
MCDSLEVENGMPEMGRALNEPLQTIIDAMDFPDRELDSRGTGGRVKVVPFK